MSVTVVVSFLLTAIAGPFPTVPWVPKHLPTLRSLGGDLFSTSIAKGVWRYGNGSLEHCGKDLILRTISCRRVHTSRCLAIFVSLLIYANSASTTAYAQAQEPANGQGEDQPVDDTAEDTPSADTDLLTVDELAELEQAMSEDAAAIADQRPAAAATGPSGNQTARAGSGIVSALQSMNPDIALIVDVAVAAFSTEDNLQTGGHDPTRSGFTLQQLEMSVSKTVDVYFRVDGNIIFSQFGVEVEEIYATTLALPGSLQARIGQFLTRFGRINATHPHTWSFVDQTFVIGRYFGGEGNRGLGMELSYLTPLPWYVEVLASATEAGGESTARSFFGGQSLPLESPLDVQSTVAVKQFFPLGDDWSLLWGLSAASGPNATGHDNRTDIYGTDVFIKYRPISRGGDSSVELQTEWLYRRRQVPRDLLSDLSGYVHGVWRWNPRWGVGARYELGLPAKNRDGDVGSDDLDSEWTENRHRISAALTYWPTEFSRVRLQSAVDIPEWRDDPIYAAMLAFEFNIGAHGAHKF